MEIQEIIKFLINPLLYAWAGLILLIFIRKHRLKLAVFLALYFYIVSIPFTGQTFFKLWKIDDTFKHNEKYDSVIVLTGVSSASWHIKRRDLPYIPTDFFAAAEASDRIFAGMYLLKNGNAKILLVGEWIYHAYNEAEAIRQLAVDMRIRNDKIHFYGQVHRTIDEVKGIKKYVEMYLHKNIVLITSEAHMRRALAMFKKHGLNPDVLSVNKENEKASWRSFVPCYRGIKISEACLYELTGYLGYRLKGEL